MQSIFDRKFILYDETSDNEMRLIDFVVNTNMEEAWTRLTKKI